MEGEERHCDVNTVYASGNTLKIEEEVEVANNFVVYKLGLRLGAVAHTYVQMSGQEKLLDGEGAAI